MSKIRLRVGQITNIVGILKLLVYFTFSLVTEFRVNTVSGGEVYELTYLCYEHELDMQ